MIVNDKERLQLEEELLMTCSKAQAINKYIDELEESSKLSELWCKSQQENARLKDKIEKVTDYVNSDEFEQLFESCANFNEANCNINHFLKEN